MKKTKILCLLIVVLIWGFVSIGCNKKTDVNSQETNSKISQKSDAEKKVEETVKVEPEMEKDSQIEKVIGVKYAKADLIIRSQPGINYSKILVIPQNAKVEVLNNSSTWFKVKYESKTGYAISEYLSDSMVAVDKPVEKSPAPTTAVKKELVIDIPYISQYKPVYAPMGCEGASLLMALKYKTGTSVGLKQFLDEMPKHPTNPYKGFASTPYEIVKGVFQSIFPEPLTVYGRKYGNVVNLSGSSVNDLKRELDKGNPIVVYVTNRNFEYPKWKVYNIEGVDYNILDNMHVMVLTGYNSDGEYNVTDPANSKNKYWVSKSKFETSYNALKWAVAVR